MEGLAQEHAMHASHNVSATMAAVLRNSFSVAKLSNYTRLIEELDQPPVWETWFFGLLIVSGCSFSAPLGMLIVPLFSKKVYERVMTFLIALGIGALSGSTLFVMIPQAFNLVQYAGYFDYKLKCWIILGALYMFFAVDRMLMYAIELRKRHVTRRKIHKSTLRALMNAGSCLTQSTELDAITDASPVRPTQTDRQKRDEQEKEDLKEELEIAMINNNFARTFSTRRRMAVLKAVDRLDGLEYHDGNGTNRHVEGNDFIRAVNEEAVQRSLPAIKFSHNDGRSHSEDVRPAPVAHKNKQSADDSISLDIQVVEKRVIEPAKIEVASVAYMIIFGSSANNFVDGMSMGAAFADSILGGLSIGTAVFSEQFPQELGTLAILMNSGLGFKKALLYNMIPIVLSYVGFAVGVLLDEIDEGYDDYIFAISSGMYLYIFLGTLIPEIRESCHELLKENLRESVIVTILQVLGIAFGVSFLFFMGELNNDEIA